jgi:uncharacterized damage-inducible protein DinB
MTVDDSFDNTRTCTMTTPLKQAILGDLDHEIATTRRVLERAPDEHYGWKPHEKSWTLGELCAHLQNLLYWQRLILEQDEFDLAASPPPRTVPASRDELLRGFDENKKAVDAAVADVDDAALGQTWTLRNGDQVIFAQPRAGVLRGMGISHMVHHRGQLSVYLRLLDVPVPAVYGPSADESPF